MSFSDDKWLFQSNWSILPVDMYTFGHITGRHVSVRTYYPDSEPFMFFLLLFNAVYLVTK
jgi:hypothetical protein